MQLVVDRGTDTLSVHVMEHPDAETVVVILPAMGVPGGYYKRFADTLHAAGMTVAITDLRGTGESRPRPSRASGYGYRELIDDIPAVLEALAPLRKNRRTILLGHSLGGQLAACHLARSQEGVDGLVLIAVGVPYWRAYGREKYGLYGFIGWISAVSSIVGWWPGWGFGGPQARGVMHDWAFTGRHGRFPAQLGVEDGLREVSVPVLAITVDDDQYTPPPATEVLLTKLESAKVRREHLTREAAGTPIDHFKWVKAGSTITGWIVDWSK